MKIVVAGDVMLDVYEHVEAIRISQEAPVPLCRHLRTENRLGGAANVAANIKAIRPEAEVVLISRVGRDPYGHTLSKLCKDAGLDAHLFSEVGHQTTVKRRFLAGDGHQMIRIDRDATYEGEDNSLAVLEELNHYAKDADVVVFSDYAKGWKGTRILQPLPRKTFVLTHCKPADFSKDYVQTTRLLAINKAEMQSLRGDTDKAHMIELAEHMFRTSGHARAYALVTLGADGLALAYATELNNQSYVSVPAFPVPVSDVTGAGDTVLATIAAWCIERPIDAALLSEAARNGASVVSQVGTSVPRISV